VALHATLFGGAEHAAQVMQVCHDVLGENGFGREWCWRVWFEASWVLGELGCWQVNIPVFCPMYFVLLQSIQQFTELGCVGRVKNPNALGAGRIMQLGFDRGKSFFLWEFVSKFDCVYVGNRLTCCSCDGVMSQTTMFSLRIEAGWTDNHGYVYCRPAISEQQSSKRL